MLNKIIFRVSILERNLGYSMKNISIPPKQRYLKTMMEKVKESCLLNGK